MELAVKRMFLGMLNSGVQAVRGGQEDRRGARQRHSHEWTGRRRRKLPRHGRGRSSCFDTSDKRFSSSQSLRLSSVATAWGGNERVVNAVKRAWFLKRGFQNNSSEKQMNDAWMTWSNQCNFMYDHNNLTLSNSVL